MWYSGPYRMTTLTAQAVWDSGFRLFGIWRKGIYTPSEIQAYLKQYLLSWQAFKSSIRRFLTAICSFES